MSDRKKFVSIWFLVGVLLAVYGVLVLGSSLIRLISPPAQQVVMGRLHAGIWWGALLAVLGGFSTWRFYPGKS